MDLKIQLLIKPSYYGERGKVKSVDPMKSLKREEDSVDLSKGTGKDHTKNGVKPYSCEQCGKYIRSNFNFNDHKDSHSRKTIFL